MPRKKSTEHNHRYLNYSNILRCAVCGREAPKISILKSSLKNTFTRKEILEYYSVTKEQAKEFFVYVLGKKEKSR